MVSLLKMMNSNSGVPGSPSAAAALNASSRCRMERIGFDPVFFSMAQMPTRTVVGPRWTPSSMLGLTGDSVACIL